MSARRFLSAILLMLPLTTHAQIPFAYTDPNTGGPARTGSAISRSQQHAKGATKPDLLAGELQNTNGNTVIRVGNAGTHSAWYPPTGSREYGPKTIATSAYGFGNQAQTLGIYTNQTQDQVDYGCSDGGFGTHPENRGFALSADQVGVCQLLTTAIPIATLSYPSQVTFGNDPSASVLQYSVASFGAPPVYSTTPPTPAVGTRINFVTPLAAAQVAVLQVNMTVRAHTNDVAHGWTGLIKDWDPNGAWLDVDAWVSLLTGPSGTPVYVGYSPLSSTLSPTTGAMLTVTTIYLNAVENGYGENSIVTMPAGGYCLFGFGCALENKELGVVNNLTPFVRTNEYNWFSDAPRNVGILLGSGGFGNSTAVAVAGGQWDKSFIAGEGVLAGFLAEPFGDFSYGVGFLSHQTTGVAFAAKNPTVQDYTYKVDARSGTTQQGGQGQTVSTIRGTVGIQSSSTASLVLTYDGGTVSDGSNEPVPMPAASSVDVVYRLQVSNSIDRNRQLTYEVECLYRRVGTAAPTLVASASTPKLPATPTPGYTQACGIDAVNYRAQLVVQQTTGSQANWVASFTATINPL